jgi:hypothetical protein
MGLFCATPTEITVFDSATDHVEELDTGTASPWNMSLSDDGTVVAFGQNGGFASAGWYELTTADPDS